MRKKRGPAIKACSKCGEPGASHRIEYRNHRAACMMGIHSFTSDGDEVMGPWQGFMVTCGRCGFQFLQALK